MASASGTAHNHWIWLDEIGKNHEVRMFETGDTLIWAAWIDADDGPVFENGIKQQCADFLENGAPNNLSLPEEVDYELHALIAVCHPAHKGREGRKRGGMLSLF
ncbi:MAG: hypothetical protein H7175_23235 [Burkholderiales bacterium]|nr:hypothetical protein [Anaerolineae bacterium]